MTLPKINKETLRNYINQFSDRLVQLMNISDKVTIYTASIGMTSSTSFGRDITAKSLRTLSEFYERVEPFINLKDNLQARRADN